MKYELIRDSTKIKKLLDIILKLKKEKPETELIKINRICKLTIHIYFQVSENKTIYFKILFPSKFAINEMKKEKSFNLEIETETKKKFKL